MTQNELWGGPYPLTVGPIPPTQRKVWFNTIVNELMIWNWKGMAWQPVSPTVSAITQPTAIGSLYIDPSNKLWVVVDDLCELTFPIAGSPSPNNGAVFVASFDPPLNPTLNALWFEPRSQKLFLWNGFTFTQIGRRVHRNVRTGNYAGTWNAGGNRSQATASGGPTLYLSGIRGIDPTTQQQLPGPGPGNTQGTNPPNTAPNANARIIQIYQNIKTIVEAEGISLFDCKGLVTSLTSAAYIGPTATLEALPQFWGLGPYPPRTHQVWLQMSGSDQEQEFSIPGNKWPPRGDIVEIQAEFSLAHVGRRKPTSLVSEIKEIQGADIWIND